VPGGPRLPGGERRKASQRRSRATTVPPASVAIPWRVGDKVHWRDRVGVYRRDVGGEQAEIIIGYRVYLVRRDALR
jgi:hypothetical protein